MGDMIPLARPGYGQAECDAVTEVLLSGRLIQGERVAAFEASVCDYTGARHAVAVNNCTSALHVSLLAMGVRPGDRVLVPALSWLSSANVIVQCGAEPVFVDVDSRTYNMDATDLARVLAEMSEAERAKVKAILSVHLFGQMADMSAIMALADQYGLVVLEDAACALGATFEKRQAGRWGQAGCFSFHPRKAITTGEGGMIITDDDRLARRLRALRNHGMRWGERGVDFVCAGYNYRMTEMQAALGVVQMGKVGALIAERIRAARRYDEALAASDWTRPFVDERGTSVFQSYVLTLPDAVQADRACIIAALKERGVETTIGSYCMPQTRWFRRTYGRAASEHWPVSVWAYNALLALPLFSGLSEEEQERVVRCLNEVKETL